MITVTWPWPQFILRAELHVSSLSELMCTWQCIKLRDKPAVTWALPLPVPGAQGAQSSSQAAILGLKGPWEGKLNRTCLEVQDGGRQCFGAGLCAGPSGECQPTWAGQAAGKANVSRMAA